MFRAFALTLLMACGGGELASLEGETVDVACGMCVYKLGAGTTGCYWSMDHEGTARPIIAPGLLPKDHENHAPDGMCNMKRQAVVTGKVYDNRFVATSFDLLPAKTDTVPEAPEFTPEDEH